MEVINQQIKEDLLNTYRGQAKTEIMFLSNKIYCDEIEGKLKSTYKCDELKKHEYILVDPNSFKIIIKRRDNSIKNWYLKYWRNSRVKIEKESETRTGITHIITWYETAVEKDTCYKIDWQLKVHKISRNEFVRIQNDTSSLFVKEAKPGDCEPYEVNKEVLTKIVNYEKEYTNGNTEIEKPKLSKDGKIVYDRKMFIEKFIPALQFIKSPQFDQYCDENKLHDYTLVNKIYNAIDYAMTSYTNEWSTECLNNFDFTTLEDVENRCTLVHYIVKKPCWFIALCVTIYDNH